MFTLRIGKKAIPALDLAAVGTAYSSERDRRGVGASTMPEGKVWRGGEEIGRVSYNGRVWPPEPWHADMVPLFDNQVSA